MTVSRTLDIPTNADLELAVRWKDTNADPYVLSDAAMQVRITEDAAESLITATVDNGFITLDAEGWATVVVPRATLLEIDYFGKATYDVILWRQLDGRSKRILEGDAILKRGSTRLP